MRPNADLCPNLFAFYLINFKPLNYGKKCWLRWQNWDEDPLQWLEYSKVVWLSASKQNNDWNKYFKKKTQEKEKKVTPSMTFEFSLTNKESFIHITDTYRPISN